MSKKLWPPLPDRDLPDTRGKGEPWHHGLLVTQERAIKVASLLFSDQVADGTECSRGCPECQQRNADWARCVREVRFAMLASFL